MPKRYSELVLSDQDFGEFYLRRRGIPDFIYDAERLAILNVLNRPGEHVLTEPWNIAWRLIEEVWIDIHVKF